jgi:hypothetical protein
MKMPPFIRSNPNSIGVIIVFECFVQNHGDMWEDRVFSERTKRNRSCWYAKVST